jgi:hypothetical protein
MPVIYFTQAMAAALGLSEHAEWAMAGEAAA